MYRIIISCCISKEVEYATGRGASAVSSPLPTTKVLWRRTTAQAMQTVVVAELADHLKDNSQMIREDFGIVTALHAFPLSSALDFVTPCPIRYSREVFSRAAVKATKEGPPYAIRKVSRVSLELWNRTIYFVIVAIPNCSSKVITNNSDCQMKKLDKRYSKEQNCKESDLFMFCCMPGGKRVMYYQYITKTKSGRLKTHANTMFKGGFENHNVTPTESQGVLSVPLFYFLDYQSVNIRSP